MSSEIPIGPNYCQSCGGPYGEHASDCSALADAQAELANLRAERDALRVAIGEVRGQLNSQGSAMRADSNELREVLSQMLHHFGNTKRDEWLNDEGFAAAQAVEAKARALVLFVPQFPYVIQQPNSNT